jgi:DNA polymerase-3 subunit epsilon
LNFSSLKEKKDVEFKSNTLYSKKIIKPSSSEYKKHNEFLKKNLKKNFF